jgi:hypothetical protein
MGLVIHSGCSPLVPPLSGRKTTFILTLPHSAWVPSGDAPHPPSVLEVNLDLYKPKPKPKPKRVDHLLFELETYKKLFFLFTIEGSAGNRARLPVLNSSFLPDQTNRTEPNPNLLVLWGWGTWGWSFDAREGRVYVNGRERGKVGVPVGSCVFAKHQGECEELSASVKVQSKENKRAQMHEAE